MDVIPFPTFKCFIKIAFSRQIKWEATSKFNGSLVTNGLAVSGQPNCLVCNINFFHFLFLLLMMVVKRSGQDIGIGEDVPCYAFYRVPLLCNDDFIPL